jgi:uncharacterized protein (TIGR03437 family)
MVRLALTQLAVGALFAQIGLTLRVASEDVAAGGVAQIKVYADQPALIAKGTLALDLDPRVFGPIESIAAFSANGDAVGLATVNGNHVEVSMLSASGGIGQLPGVPIFAVRAPVLTNAVQTGFISLSQPQDPQIGRYVTDTYPTGAWADPTGKAYATTLLSATVSTNYPIGIGNVTPGWGFQIAGTVLQIDGTGFDGTATLTADGVAFSSIKLVSPTRIDATLASSVELTGVPFHVSQSRYTSTYFAQPPSVLSPPGTDQSFIAGRHVIVPITDRTQTSFFLGGGGSKVGIVQNPSAQPIELQISDTAMGSPVGSRHYTLAPGTSIPIQLPAAISPSSNIQSQSPFRALEYYSNISTFGVQDAQSSDTRPVLSSVVNGASHTASPIAPGEILTLHGIEIGPAATGLTLDSSGRIQADAGPNTQVLINGVAAPVLYASPSQWNVIVPYELDGSTTATVRVRFNGGDSKTWTVPAAPTAPGIFTIGATGAGQGAILNQDNTVNSPDNPAPNGTIIQIFATGAGQTFPASTTGSVTPSTGGGSVPYSVKIFYSGTEGAVVFSGPAPGFASGALQVNAVVPRFGSSPTTRTVSLVLEINGVRSAPVSLTIR